MPQVNSPTSSQVLMRDHLIPNSGKGPKPTSKQNDKNTHSNEQESESGDVVNPKTPTVNKKNLILSERFTDEETIKPDEDTSMSEERDSPQYTSASSDDHKNHNNKNAPSKGRKARRLSQSLIMDNDQNSESIEDVLSF